MTAPDFRGRLRAIRERGGKVVVVDPRRSRTAEAADEHHFIRPGRDAHLLAAMAATILEEGLDDPGDVGEHVEGLDRLPELLAPFDAESAAPACGIEAEEIRRMARELAAAPSAAVYARIGTTTQEFGTLASWLVDVLNTITGNLDRPGGVMFPLAAAGQIERQRRARSRSRRQAGALDLARARPPRVVRRAAGGHARRGDRDRGRGPGPGAVHGRRQPAALDAERRPPATRLRRAGADGLASTPT